MSQLRQPLSFFDLESLAKTLKLASIDIIKTSSTEIESHWFRSSGPADLYFWKSKNKIVKHQVSLYGQVVEWNEFDGTKTGYVSDDQGSSELICFDKELNRAVLAQVSEFLDYTEGIDPEILTKIRSHHTFISHMDRWPLFKALRRLVKR